MEYRGRNFDSREYLLIRHEYPRQAHVYYQPSFSRSRDRRDELESYLRFYKEIPPMKLDQPVARIPRNDRTNPHKAHARLWRACRSRYRSPERRRLVAHRESRENLFRRLVITRLRIRSPKRPGASLISSHGARYHRSLGRKP